jgi:hypothetical protein
MKRDFRDFLAWAILVPLLLPIVILGVLLFLNAPGLGIKEAWASVLGRPDFLIYSAALSGETYAELKGLQPAKGHASRPIWDLSTIFLPSICVMSVAAYTMSYARSDFETAQYYWVSVLTLTLLTVFFGLLSWMCFNQQRYPQQAAETHLEGG